MTDLKLKSAPLAYQNEPFLNSPDGRILRLLSEYSEPLSRFRREQIQDTVVFFGSARIHSRERATNRLTEVRGDGALASAAQQAADMKRAEAAVDMARYYEDARRLAFLLTEWSTQIPAKRHRFVVTTGGGPGIMERRLALTSTCRLSRIQIRTSRLRSISSSIISSCASSGLPIWPKRW
jgi:hypothetical protein